jgi:hypothetical protein
MGSLSNIVNVQITRQTSVPTRVGFGTGAFLSNDAGFQNRTKIYGSLSEVQDDSLAGADTLAAATVYFGQQLAPTKLTAIKMAKDVAQGDKVVFDAAFVTDNVITTTIDNGTPIVTNFDTDNDTTLANLAAAIQGDAAVSTATDTPTDTIDIVYADFAAHTIVIDVTGGASQPTATITTEVYPDAVDTIAGTLADAVAENNDWYALGIWSRLDADILSTAAWVQGQGTNNPKLYFAQSDEALILDGANTSDIASQLQALAYFRTSIWYHALDAEYLDMGVMGGQLPTDAGSITWAYKQVSGVTVDDLTDAKKNAAHGKAANTYDTVASVNITEEGKVSDSPFEWIDVIRGVDWIQANMSADLYELLIQSPKIPYDNSGIARVESIVINRLRLAQDQGILSTDSDPVVTAPDISQVSASDKANRILNDVEFSAVLAGAIQKINVQGTVTLI